MSKNHLYPVFMKVHDLSILIVGGGFVCQEKLHFLLKSSPKSKVTIVAPEIRDEVLDLIDQYKEADIHLKYKPFEPEDVSGHQLIIAATSIEGVNQAVQAAAKSQNVLINVADSPELCDFYLGGIVTKGNVKIAISSNGQSPTLTKRIRQLLEDLLPEEIDLLAENLHQYRDTLKMDFEEKVQHLNKLTEDLLKN